MPYLQDLARLKQPLDAIAVKVVSVLPHTVMKFLARIPEPINRRMMEHFLNNALRHPLADGEFDFLNGHTVAIEVLDLDWSITITSYGDRRLHLLGSKKAETMIKATTKDFVELASGHADPDTLFFQRRLCIEGNVALGLETKNTLDGVDRDALPVPFRAMLRLAAVWLSRYGIFFGSPAQPWARLSSPARPYQ